MASNPYAPYSSRNELRAALDNATDKYVKLLDSYKSQTPMDSGSIPTKAEVDEANRVKIRLIEQFYSSLVFIQS